MKFRLNSGDLKKALTILCNVIPKMTRIPILSHIKFEIPNEEYALLSATDENIFLYRKVPLKGVEHFKGTAFTLEGRSFLDLLKTFNKKGDVVIKLASENRVRIQYEKSKHHLKTLDHSQFPKKSLPKKDDYNLFDSSALLLALKKVETASGKDISKEALKCIYLEPTKDDGFIRAVASDGVQLLTCKVNGVLDEPILIPKGTTGHIIKSLADSVECGLYLDESHIYVRYEEGLICSRKPSCKFPNYKQLFSKGSSIKITAPIDPLKTAIKRVALFSKKTSLTFTPDCTLQVEGTDKTGGSYEEIELKKQVETPNEATKLYLNTHLLVQLLDQFDGEDITINIFSTKKPVLFTGAPNMVGLFMPFLS